MIEPLISIIIVNWNAKDYLKDCISSLYSQSYKNLEIILVDNASTDGSVEMIEQEFPKIQIIKNKENLGFAEGNNIGISKSKGEFIALFNPDAIADKEWISELVSVISNSEKICGVTGKLFYLDKKTKQDSVFCTWSKISPFSANPYNFHNSEPKSKVDYLSGAAMLVKRDIIEKVGLLDPGYFLYFEETDWCARMIRIGFDLVYVPNAIVWHAVSPLSDSEKKIFYMERNRIRFAIKNFDLKNLPLFYAIFLGESILIFGRDLKRRNFLRTKIRFRVILWNISQFSKTWNKRKIETNFLKKNFKIRSYNNSLPLRTKTPTN